MGNLFSVYSQTSDFPDLSEIDIVIFGVNEDRNAVNNIGCAEAPDYVREKLYNLFPGDFEPRIADLGNIRQGHQIEDTYYAVKSVFEVMIANSIIPIVIGGSQDISYANYKAYESLGQIINIVAIDSEFDIGTSEDELSSKSFLSKIILHQPNFLFNFTNIGYQTYYVDQDAIRLMKNLFFDVYRLGDPADVLTGVEKIVLTESSAKKYFGDEDPMGKMLLTDQRSFMVAGIVQDPPPNSHFNFNMIIPMDNLRSLWPGVDQPGPFTFYSYLKVKDENTKIELEKKVRNDIWDIMGYTVTGDSANIPEGFSAEYIFNPILDIHLNGHAEKEITKNNDRQNVFIFSFVAVFILIIASINYMNLATARSANRGKEIGVKKVVGANRSLIFNQFMLESAITTFISLILALIIASIILPYFSDLSGKSLSLNLLVNLPLLFSLILIWIIVSVLSGLYPAIFLSKFNPLKVLYSNTRSETGGKFNLYFRHALVLFQFVISVFLIICVLMVYQQLKFINTKDTGFDKERVAVVPLSGRVDMEKIKVLKNELKQNPNVEAVSLLANVPGERIPYLTVRVPDIVFENMEQNEEGDDVIGMRVLSSGYDIVDALGLTIIAGRGFSEEFSTDENEAFILNEAAVIEFGLEDPVGKRFEYLYGLQEPKAGRIVGIIKDYNFATLHSEVEPLMIHIWPDFCRYVCIKLNTDDYKEVVGNIEETWLGVYPNEPFDHFFLDTFYENLYRSEMNMARIILYFTILAIIIACMGLLGLVSYTTAQRTKEIGIRKILGAPMGSVLITLSKDYVYIVAISFILASIPAWYYLNNWLANFEYRIGINYSIFILSGLIAIGIALLIVSFHTYKAAVRNPVEALYNE